LKPVERFIMKHPILIAIGLTLVGLSLLVGYVVIMDKTHGSVFLTGFILLSFLLICIGFGCYYFALKMISRYTQKNYHLLQKLQHKIHEHPSPVEPASPSPQTNEISALRQQLEEAKRQLIEQEKIVTMGTLSAGIAHEIKNPLNFINNFSEMTLGLVKELKEELIAPLQSQSDDTKQNIGGILDDITVNCEKINEHGKRAESIIQNMLIHARTSKVDKSDIDVNSLLEEYLNLAYHGMRAQNSNFNVKFEKKLDKNIDKIKANQQSLGRVFLNIINNGLYAANEQKEKIDANFMPTISIATSHTPENVIIKIRDNGSGIPKSVQEKIFEPFFTTKPAGQGTGLGLPICYDIIVNELGGKLDVTSEEGQYTEFTITIPKDKSS
jgi:two-component system, NtrC family, sensor kinase